MNELAAHGKIATVSASFQMTSSTTSFNSISEQTGPCKATPLAPDSFGGKGWEQTTQPSVSTRMFQKTSAHVTTGHRPPNLQKWKTILVWLTLTEALRKAKRWHDALFGGCLKNITTAGSEQGTRLPQDPAYTPGRAVTGTPKPTKLLSWEFLNVLVTSYPRSRMNAQAGSPTDELLIFPLPSEKQVGRKPKLKVGNWMIWPQCWTQNGILALEHFAQVFFMCLHTAGNMTGGHTASANEFSQNPHWKTFKRFTWISCMLHSCVQFQISLVIGWHRISAACEC